MGTMSGSDMLVDPHNRRESQLVVASLAASIAIHAAAFGLAPRVGIDPSDPPAPLSVFLRLDPPGPKVPEEKPAARPSAEASTPAVPRGQQIAPREKRIAPPRRELTRAHRQSVPATVPATSPIFRQTESSDSAPGAEPTPHERAPEVQAPAAVAAVGARNVAAHQAVTPPAFRAEYLRNPAPRYPLRARRDGVEGTVMLKVLVTAAGLPGSVEIQASSGSVALDRAAEDAVKSWRFVPARRGDAAVDAWVVVPVVFHLESG
jgi:protein TonB